MVGDYCASFVRQFPTELNDGPKTGCVAVARLMETMYYGEAYMSNPSDSLYRETWYDTVGRRLTVTCDETSGLVEVMLPDAQPEGMPVEIEILRQPTDSSGQAIGPSIRLLSQKVACRPLPNAQKAIGRFWLPANLVSPNIRSCYFRLR